MQYTVCSRGQVIGTTDLGFVRIEGDPVRAGWFHPNAHRETVMPMVTSMHGALRAYASHRASDPGGGRLVKRDLIGSAVFADIAEALQHLESLELTLHREDGSLVPTELIGLQDTEELLALNRPAEHPCDDASFEDESWLDELDDELEGQMDEEPILEAELPDRAEGWSPHEESIEWPRYQIIVHVANGDVIP